MILAGDVGGTKTRLSIYELLEGKPVQRANEQYSSVGSTGLAPIVQKFLADKKVSIETACFGIPGPVINGMARTTNLPWLLSERELSNELHIPNVKLVNDLVATTASIPHISLDGLITIHGGSATRDRTVCAVLAPGTGTGQGFLCPCGGKFVAFASEGGHVNFSPTNELEDRLLLYLRDKIKGHVSVERVLSGPGLVNVYEFLKHTGAAVEPPELSAKFVAGDAPAIVASCGLSGEFEICIKALDVFSHILGSHAGDLVLTYMATGGLYLGGGIPPKIASKLVQGQTLAGYLNKGRLSDLVKSTPLHIIKDDHAALLGAASIAADMLQ